MYRIKLNFILCLMAFVCPPLIADEQSELLKSESARLDLDPWVSARAAGMGGALSTIADGLDAPYYNPAVIGGFKEHEWSKFNIRGVHFPYFGASVNENTADLYQQHQQKGAASPRVVGESLLEVNQGKRQFFRNSAAFSWHWYRMVIIPFYDRQFAAYRLPGVEQGGENIRFDHMETTGIGYGFSASSKDDSFSIGFFGTSESRKRAQGDVTVEELVDTTKRAAEFGDRSVNYTGNTLHFGALWQLGKKLRPRLAVVNRHVGESQYSASDPDAETLNIPNDLTVGFSFGPKISRKGRLSWLVEVDKLTQPQVAMAKKVKTAFELTLGGPGRDGVFGLRAGLGIAGGSGGVNFNLGVLEFEAAIESRDVGRDHHIVPDRRAVASFAIHLLPR